MVMLFKTLVLHLLEYGSQVWSPSAVLDIRSLEAVQRTFTAKMDGMRELDYWERLDTLKMYSLERRRERYQIIYVWKIISGRVPNIVGPGEETITCFSHVRRGLLCRLPQINYRCPARVINALSGSLLHRGAKLFNFLPSDIRRLDLELQSFKSKLDKFLLGVPDRPLLPIITSSHPPIA